jgi:hypothetical protein
VTKQDSIPADRFARSLNLLSGLSVGNHYIVPAAFSSFNFDITYGLGNLTVTQGTLTIKTKDTTMNFGGTVPVFYSLLDGIAYKDKISDILTGPPTYTILDANNNPVLPGNLNPGTYQVMPGAAPLSPTANYSA